MKKALSLALVIAMLFTLGFLAFAEEAMPVVTEEAAPVVTEEVAVVVDDNPPHTICETVAEGDTMNTNYGTVEINSGTINNNAEFEPGTGAECANGLIKVNGITGQVVDNFGMVNTNTGSIARNDGTVTNNAGTIAINGEFSQDGGVGPAKGCVVSNRDLVDVNDGVIFNNTKTSHMIFAP